MFRIFIGWDSRFPEAAEVLAHSLHKHSSIPLDIRHLKVSELRFHRARDPLAATEFFYSRFLVPHLCGYRGTALYLDSCMLCLGDISEIAALDMNSFALRVVKHDVSHSASGKTSRIPLAASVRSGWSSVMLLNCEQLSLWTKDVVETATAGYLHRFDDIPEDKIGELPGNWHSLQRIDHDTKMFRWTTGGPWLEQNRECVHADVWQKARAEMCATDGDPQLSSILLRRSMPAPLSVAMPNGVSPVAR
jgi:hypothetical protein